MHALCAIYVPPRIGERLFGINLHLLKSVNRLFLRAEVEGRARALRLLIEMDAYYCMDGATDDVLTRYYGFDKETRLIQVPAPASIANAVSGSKDTHQTLPHLSSDFLPEASATSSATPISIERDGGRISNGERNVITLAWYGRLCDFKAYPLAYLISRMGKLESDWKVKLIVVGDGEERQLLERTAVQAGVDADFKGTIENEPARRLLRQEAHIAFAMGTAAHPNGSG